MSRGIAWEMTHSAYVLHFSESEIPLSSVVGRDIIKLEFNRHLHLNLFVVIFGYDPSRILDSTIAFVNYKTHISALYEDRTTMVN